MSRKTTKKKKKQASRRSAWQSWVIIDSRCVAGTPFRTVSSFCFELSHTHTNTAHPKAFVLFSHDNTYTHDRQITQSGVFFTLNATQYYLKFKYFCELNLFSRRKIRKKQPVLFYTWRKFVCWSINVIYAWKTRSHLHTPPFFRLNCLILCFLVRVFIEKFELVSCCWQTCTTDNIKCSEEATTLRLK